jgi:lipopolysaccharide export system permease protein
VPYLIGSFLLTCLSFGMHAWFVPNAVHKRMDFEYAWYKNKHEFEGRNIHKKIDNNSFVYLYSYNQFRQEAYLFSIEVLKDNRLLKRISAERALWQTHSKSWKLLQVKKQLYHNNTIIENNIGNLDTTIMLSPDDIYQRESFAESLTLNDLSKLIDLERQRGSDFIKDLELERHARYAFPFATPILTLIGVTLASRKKRGGIALQLGLGFLITFLYVLILSTAKVLIGDYFPAWLAVWLPNAIFSIVALILLKLSPAYR